MSFSCVALTNPENLVAALSPQTNLIWVETPTNPLLKLADLRAVAEIARSRGILAAADNTFASPFNQRPLELGFDIVVHSATKYLNGHSDIIGGVAIVGTAARLDPVRERLAFLQNAVGAIASPVDSFLALRGLKTLALRVECHNSNALTLAQWLQTQPRVNLAHDPGLPSHPQHALAQAQQPDGFGGMISLDLAIDLADARRFLEAMQIFALAESLGGVEDLDDLRDDLTQALAVICCAAGAGIWHRLCSVAHRPDHTSQPIEETAA